MKQQVYDQWCYRFLLMIMSVAAIFVMTGCQSKVYLMPTPVIMTTGDVEPFSINPNLEQKNNISVLYATNRNPMGNPDDRSYSIYPGDELSFGIASFVIENDDLDWKQIFRISTTDENQDKLELKLTELEELETLPLTKFMDDQPEHMNVKPDLINEYLEQSLDKDILVYVHGANTNAYRGAAMAAQYRHFTGHNSMVIPFLWPSTGRLIRYGKDVVHAKESVPAFIRLIEYLSRYTDAEHIDILAYSAGSQIVSASLARLGMEKKGDERTNLRIGDVYYAAADIGIDLFSDDLKTYRDIPHNVTLTINEKDSVLKHTQRYHRVSRAGKPNPEDLSEETIIWFREISRENWFDILSVDEESVSELPKGAHDFWYSHPWVSSDVLLYFLFQARPAERGLLANYTEKGLQYWSFPPDYKDRVIGILKDENQN